MNRTVLAIVLAEQNSNVLGPMSTFEGFQLSAAHQLLFFVHDRRPMRADDRSGS